jgi:hypothetical protein
VTPVRAALGQKLFWVVVGGFAFWLPTVVLSAIYRWNVSTITLNLASLVGIALVALIAWVAAKRVPRWGWVLAGVYILGPTAMFVAAAFARIPPTTNLPGDWIWRVMFCLFPPMTLWMATLDGMIFSVLLVTIALPLFALSRSK